MLKVSDLRLREVINVVDGRRLGPIKDIDIDVENGTIRALVLNPEGGRMFRMFGRQEDIVIPWENINKIGIDVILVELEQIAYNYE
ncbi:MULTISPECIES: YlmC/YmxH family sporulation protein [Carboxydocella]|uniref:Sporulation protein, YlmC/YmxH family n=2 Tax=Carboxydocella TaxID=178898 RepID=A0A1T4M994_9FIRM|nr:MULTISPECIES: YlmC/YmxH family sporulation protein [Carboxydocella]AVX20990.1 sporulation protein, YlmC/YmxH family [Carboxydocella thermautotrophica]AVX31408.1 sporulation protein, YlmC/YmxH family [Carboxydocella thermautotrophica]GAW30994.1 hypothetical protein JDF658_07590 [Carboxydocella sp. JDF658]SJZ63502.1 sporulation protein, YlmC/YmxH family [Carboxydocella sporoproducens DSM 16521]